MQLPNLTIPIHRIKLFRNYSNQKRIILILLLVVFGAIINLYHLNKAPANITADELGFMVESLRLAMGRWRGWLDFCIAKDQACLALMPNALLYKILGANHALLATRLPSIIFTLIAGAILFTLIEETTSSLIAFLMILLFLSSYWTLNFSRSGWNNTHAILLALGSYYLIHKAFHQKKLIYLIFASFFSALSLYIYTAGKVFVLVSLAYLFAEGGRLILRHQKTALRYTGWITLYILLTLLLFAPHLHVILKNKTQYFTRTKTAFVLTAIPPKAYNSYAQATSLKQLFRFQAKQTFNQIFLLGKIDTRSVENQRYLPANRPIFGYLTKILFSIGLLTGIILFKEIIFWWLLLFANVALSILTTFPVNGARLILLLPVIYFFAGLGAWSLWRITALKIPHSTLSFKVLLTVVVLLAVLNNLKVYWSFATSPNLTAARQPAIQYLELPLFLNWQIDYAQKGKAPFISDEWERLKHKKPPQNYIEVKTDHD